MKIVVSPVLKGKFGFSFIYGSFTAGQEIPLTKEQIDSFEVQNALRSGLIQSVGGSAINEQAITEYKNISKTIQAFGFGVSARPGQVFIIDSKYNNHSEIQLALKEGRIVKNEESKSNKSSKKDSAPKKIKLVSNKNKPYVVDPNSELDNKTNPKGVYIHDPNKNQKNISPIEKQILDLEIEENEDGMNFVDRNQSKEKLLKMSKKIQGK